MPAHARPHTPTARLPLALLVALALAAAPAPLAAQQPDAPDAQGAGSDEEDAADLGDEERAELYYQRAVEHFNGGRYRQALAAFDRSLELAPDALTYCNRGYVLIKLTELDAALDSLETCLSTFEGPQAERGQIAAQVEGVRGVVRHVRPRAMNITQDIAAGPVTSAPGEPRREKGWGASDFGYLSLGLSAALLASGVTLDLLSADLRRDFIAESEGGPGTSPRRYEELRERYVGRQRVFWSLTISGSVLAAAGLTLLAYDLLSVEERPAGQASDGPGASRAPSPSGRWSLQPVLSPGGGGLVWRLSF